MKTDTSLVDAAWEAAFPGDPQGMRARHLEMFTGELAKRGLGIAALSRPTEAPSQAEQRHDAIEHRMPTSLDPLLEGPSEPPADVVALLREAREWIGRQPYTVSAHDLLNAIDAKLSEQGEG